MVYGDTGEQFAMVGRRGQSFHEVPRNSTRIRQIQPFRR